MGHGGNRYPGAMNYDLIGAVNEWRQARRYAAGLPEKH